MAATMAPIVMKRSATWDQLLVQWQAQRWAIVRSAVISQVPVGKTSGKVLIATQVDAFEWQDVTFFGIGNVDDAISKLQAYIKQGGSQLHAYALFKRTDFDAFGFKVVSYRLVLYHSIVQLAIGAVAIIAIAVAALVFIQYIATGTPPVQSLQQLWSGLVKPVDEGVQGIIGAATGGISTAWILAIIGSGAIAIAIGRTSQATGVKLKEPKGPGGSIGVRAGGVTGRVST